MVAALSDNLADFTFKLDGTCYQLPLAYQELTKQGWVLSSSGAFETTILDPGKRESVQLSKAGNRVYAMVENMTDEQMKLRDCTVYSIEVDAGHVDNAEYFQIAKSISPFSNADDVMDAFGEPNSNIASSDHNTIKYYFDNDSIGDPCASFTIYQKENMQKFSGIRLTCSKVFEQKELNTAMPEYLKDYKPPSALGSDYTSGNFELAGKVYHMPVPVDELLRDGWTFTSKPTSVAAGSGQMAEIIKDGKKASISVRNEGDYETTIENTIVRSIAVDSDYKDQADLVLAGGFKLGMTEQQLKAIVKGDVSYNNLSSSIMYSWENRKPSHGFSVRVGNDTKKVVRVSISTDEIWFLE